MFDQRGTGRSGALRCRPSSGRTSSTPAGRRPTARRASAPRRAFYTTPDTVEDIEAIRQQLGIARIALYGTSYGTKVALAYALKYPANVERLVLDSVVEADGPDALYLDSFEAVPRALGTLCRAACRRFTPDPGGGRAGARGPPGGGPATRPRSTIAAAGRRIVELTRADVFSILVSGRLRPRRCEPTSPRPCTRR